MNRTNRILVVICAASVGVCLWLIGSEHESAVATVSADSIVASMPHDVVQPLDEGSIAFPVMEAKTPADVRTVRRFCRTAQEEERDALRHAATCSPDPLVAGNALRALGRLGAVAGDAELEALLTDTRQRVRQEAVIALGQSRSVSAVEKLLPLADERDPMMRPLVLQALGRLGGERAKAVLESVLADERSSEAERALARAGLGRG